MRRADGSRPSTAMTVRRKKPKVIMVPRIKENDYEIVTSTEKLIATLMIPPLDRTNKDIDTILSVVGKWDDFTRHIHSDQMRREVCRQMNIEEHKANTVLFKAGAEPDGWYLIVSGQCGIVLLEATSSVLDPIPPQIVNLLRREINHDDAAGRIVYLGPKREFGSSSLINNKTRNATVVITEPSVLLRVDSQLYKDTAQYYTRSLLQKKAQLLSTVDEFRILADNPEVYLNIAENVKECSCMPRSSLEDMQKTDKKAKREASLYVVVDGLIDMYRSIDFSTVDKSDIVDSDADDVISLHFPSGRRRIKVKSMGRGCLFPDPAFNLFAPSTFTLKFIEPTNLLEIKVSNLAPLLTISQFAQVKALIIDIPDDKQVCRIWFEKQRKVQWESYKKQCVKDARRSMKMEKALMTGQFLFRKPGIPKSIKHYESGRAESR